MWVTWRAAMREALYGSHGFYARGERPAAHFRTSVQASPRYAAAMLALLREIDASLGHPARLDLVDIGAGRGELLSQMLAMARHALALPGQLPGLPPAAHPSFAERILPLAVEITPRPEELDPRIRWSRSVPSGVTGLVIANEWLDTIPLDVADLTTGGPRLVVVNTATGAERPGPPADGADRAWLSQWWPLRSVGDHAEIGSPRCAAWAGVITRLAGGLAVGVDYGHMRAARPMLGTLAGYLDGRPVRPIPDGSRDITAHVAVDACAAAGARAGATQTLLTTQRVALRALGVRASRPPLATAGTDPHGYLAALCLASEEAELTDPSGLGAFSWLLQAVRVPLPASLAPASLAPASLAPASLAPASLAPASLAPASLAPASLAPASVAPASLAPAAAGQSAAPLEHGVHG